MNAPPRVPLRRIVLLLLPFLFPPAPSAAPNYTFVSVAEVTGPFNAFDVPALNDQGAVAFFATLAGGGQAICRADASGVDIITDTITGPFYSFTGAGTLQLQSRPDIDNLGRVVYRAYIYVPPFDYHAALFQDDGVTRTALTQWGPGATHRLDWSNATTNGAGQSAFTGLLGAVQGVHLATASSYSVLVDEADGFSATFSTPSVSPGGDVSFSAVKLPNLDGLYAILGGTPHSLAVSGVDCYSHAVESSLNDAGQVVFLGQPEEFVDAIMAATVDSVWTIVDDMEGEFREFAEPAINNAGLVVFYAQLSGYIDGLFSGPDHVQNAIIRTGDPLFGSICNFIQFANGGLNQHGQVAFVYGLEDGRMGIAVGTPGPVAVPTDSDPTSEGGERLLSIWPNPASDCVRLRPTGRRGPQPASAEIFDAAGRLIRRLGPEEALPGWEGWSWDGRTTTGERAGSGVYFIRLGGPGGRWAGRLIMTR